MTQTERAALVSALEETLSNEGCKPDDEAQLPEEVGWTPDRIFVCPEEKKIALEIEEEVSIPRFLVRIAESCKNYLEDTSILVAAVRNTPLKLLTARTGIENGISVYADASDPTLVLDSSFPEKMASVPTELIDAANQRFSGNKRIPLVLTQELEGLDHLAYAGDLRQFAHDYESVQFETWESEHQFVHDFLTNHFADQLSSDELFEGLNTLNLLEEVSEVILGKRPHFLHSFQTFLLGAIVIDKHYEIFEKLYSAGFETEESVPIDLPWLFTSLFHDVASAFENIENISPVGRLREVRPRGISSLYSPHLLSSLFELLKAGAISPEWEPQLESTGGGLQDLLARYRWNEHGVMGAISLILTTQNLNRRTLATVVYPSALAISLHSSHLWPQLLERKLFPVSAQKFPLVFLLLFCDNIEEWGREMHTVRETERNPKALITGLNLDQYLACLSLGVDEPARAIVIKNRHDWITQKLFDTEGLRTKCLFSRFPTEE